MSDLDHGPDQDDEPEGSSPARPRYPFPSDDELRAAGWVKVSRRERLITSTPRVGQYFWVDFPHDAYHPEFVDEHPGIVVRAARRLHDTCIIVPITSSPQEDAKHKWRLSRNPNPLGHRKGVVAWAVCDHLYTVNINRLRPVRDRYGKPVFPRVDEADLQGIFAAIRGALHHVFGVSLPGSVAPSGANAQPATPSRPLGANTLTLPKKP